MSRIFIAVLLGLLALAGGVGAVVAEECRLGAAIGLALGTLLGPMRIVAVDFRQWFKDPGTPNELGDDSPIGLMRSGFRNPGLAALLAFFPVFLLLVRLRGGVACTLSDPSWVAALPGAYLQKIAAWYLGYLAECSGGHLVVKLLAWAAMGAVAAQAVVELAWRGGLNFGPAEDPARPRRYLVERALPRLPAKVEQPGRRRLIVCCDGTWNVPEPQLETNVVRLVRSIVPDDHGIAQIVHYHEGVGTGNVVDRIAGGGAGVGLSASVKACYGFLVDNYREHDEIFLFGFSRGAYVVRALGGLIGLVGIMRKLEMDRFADMWNWYWQEEDKRAPADLQKIAPKRYQNVEIECIGVWDTVGALGIPGSRFCAQAFAFHDTGLGPHVRHAFQALAMDERRGNFQAAVWVPLNPDTGAQRSEAAGISAHADRSGPEQVLKQVWFPGVHSNVGGGYLKHGLSDTTFLWMLSELSARRLLGLEPDCVLRALDADVPAEGYPAGVLEDSSTTFWRLIGSPVPRPVGVVSQTERVHESAWKRSEAAAELVGAGDIYKQPQRRAWLTRNRNLAVGRSAFEQRTAGQLRPRRTVNQFPKKTDFCSWLLGLVSARD